MRILKPLPGTLLMPGHPLADAVGFWPMNSLGNQVFDLSVNMRRGTLIGNTHFVPGYFGWALDFNSAGDGVNVTGLTAGTKHTIIAWVRKESHSQSDDFIFDSQSGREILAYMDAGGVEEWAWYDGAWHRSGVPIIYGKIHQVAIVRNGTAGEIFVDGKSIYKAIGNAVSIGGTTAIGSRYTFSNSWTGLIDHFVILNRALSNSEIALLYLLYREPFCMFPENIMPEFAISA